MTRLSTFLCGIVIYVMVLSTPVYASWSFREGPTEFITADYAFGVSDTGQTLNVYCDQGVPTVMAWGYPARPGAMREEALEIFVEGNGFTVTATHVPPDGYWEGPAPVGLIDALRSGAVAMMKPESAANTAIDLSGSSRTISTALAGCSNGPPASTGSNEAAVAAPSTGLAQIEAAITSACGGRYVLNDTALLTGLIDNDTVTDFVLDWAGVLCQSSAKGRGAGNCGINMCQISVVLTELEDQIILGVAPELISDAFGRVRLQTIALRPSCPDSALDCVFLWNVTNEGLEAMLVSE